jgi:hypothetical protein
MTGVPVSYYVYGRLREKVNVVCSISVTLIIVLVGVLGAVFPGVTVETLMSFVVCGVVLAGVNYLGVQKKVQDFDVKNDVFDRKKEAHSLARHSLSFVADAPVVIAVEGRWGSGKTHFMRQMYQYLSSVDACPIWFDPLDFRSQSVAWRELSTKIHEKINPFGTALWKSIFDFPDYIRAVFTSLTSVDVPDWAVWLRRTAGVSLKENVRSYLKSLGKRSYVIFIDDLDRLAPGQAKEVVVVAMQHLKEIFDIVIVGIDRDRLLHLLGDGDANTQTDAQTYLDKLIDIRHPLLRVILPRFPGHLVKRINS